MLNILDLALMIIWFALPALLVLRGRTIAFQCAVVFFWLAPFCWGWILTRFDPENHAALIDHVWLIVGLPAAVLYCGAIGVGKWLFLLRKANRPKWELITEYPVTEYKCGLRQGDIIRLHKDLTIRDHNGVETGVFPCGEESVVLSGMEGTIFLRRPNKKRHTWTDDDSIFEYYERVGHIDEIGPQ